VIDLQQNRLIQSGGQESLTVLVDGIAAQPFAHLLFGPVRGWIPTRMPTVPVGEGFDKRRALARARLCDGAEGRLVHDVDVVPVDQDRIKAVGRRAVCGRVLDGRHRFDRRVLHVPIVFANENHRQLPDDRKVERLMKGTDVGGAVAEETDGDLS
jgi:hypothetical protein